MNNEEEVKWSYALDNKRFYAVAFMLLFIFLVFMTLIYFKADEITKDPCQICAERQGEAVVCSLMDGSGLQRIYETNGTVRDKLVWED